MGLSPLATSSPTNCWFERRGGQWTRTACGWTFPHEADEPPRRNCPQAPCTVAEYKARFAKELLALAAEKRTVRTGEQMLATIDACFGGCEHLQDNLCRRRGSGCKRRARWIECIALSGCDREKQVA